MRNQLIRLTNYDMISFNEFEFTSLTLYNFKVSEETFKALTDSAVTVLLDDLNVAGDVSLNKLLLSPNFSIKVTVPLIKTTVIESKDKKSKKGKKLKKDMSGLQKEEVKTIQTNAGSIDLEINLQRGDTEEELERNY